MPKGGTRAAIRKRKVAEEAAAVVNGEHPDSDESHHSAVSNETVLSTESAVKNPAPDLKVTISGEDGARLNKDKRERVKRGRKKATINMFHEHMAQIREYPIEMLRIFVQAELQRVQEWSAENEKDMYDSLIGAIPDMSTVLSGSRWPEPDHFSPVEATNAYVMFLEAFLSKHSGDSMDAHCSAPRAADKDDCFHRPKKSVSFHSDADCIARGKRGRASRSNAHNGATKAPSRKRSKKKKNKRSAKTPTPPPIPEATSGSDSAPDKSEEDSPSSPSTEPSSSSISSSSSSTSSSDSSSSDSSTSSSEEEKARRRKRKRKRRKHKKRKKRSKRARKRRSKKRRKAEAKKNKHAKRKSSFQEHIRAVEHSQKIGAKKYSQEHLFSCRKVVAAYRTWSNPTKLRDKKATVPKVVREFADTHLADDDARLLEVYDLPHVSKNAAERKHVTFLMNKIGGLTCQVASARLERARMSLDKHNRIIEGAKLSKKARDESIKCECDWASQIRWYSEIISEGVASFFAARGELEGRKRLYNFLAAHPDVEEAEAEKIIKRLSSSSEGGAAAAPTARAVNVTSGDKHSKQINALKSQIGQLMKKQAAAGGGGGSQVPGHNQQQRQKDRKNKFACWHCGSKNHAVADCPVAKQGKPPVKGSFFYKRRTSGEGGSE